MALSVFFYINALNAVLILQVKKEMRSFAHGLVIDDGLMRNMSKAKMQRNMGQLEIT